MTQYPRCSTYGIFAYIWVIYGVIVARYSMHGYDKKTCHRFLLSGVWHKSTGTPVIGGELRQGQKPAAEAPEQEEADV